MPGACGCPAARPAAGPPPRAHAAEGRGLREEFGLGVRSGRAAARPPEHEDDADDQPHTEHRPRLPRELGRERGDRQVEDEQDEREHGRDDTDGETGVALAADAQRTVHRRFALAQDQERDADEEVGDDDRRRTCVDDPSQGRRTEERCQGGERSDEEDRVDRGAVARVQFAEPGGDHSGRSHRPHEAGRAHEEGVPRSDDSGQTAGDDELAPERGIEHGCQCVRGDEIVRGQFRRGHGQRRHPDDDDVEGDGHEHRGDDEFADLLRRQVDLLSGLRDDVEADEEERHDRDDGDET